MKTFVLMAVLALTPAGATSQSESAMDALARQIQPCWNPPFAAPEVRVTFRLTRQGALDGPVRWMNSTTRAEGQQAFEAARRAVERCVRDGFDLPEDTYETWREVQMTFALQ